MLDEPITPATSSTVKNLACSDDAIVRPAERLCVPGHRASARAIWRFR